MSHPHSTIDNHIPWSVCCNTDLFLTFFIFYLSFFGSAQLSHTPEININPKAKKNYRPLNVTSVSHPIPDRFVLTSKNIVKFNVTKVKQLKLRNKQKLIFLPKNRDKFHFKFSQFCAAKIWMEYIKIKKQFITKINWPYTHHFRTNPDRRKLSSWKLSDTGKRFYYVLRFVDKLRVSKLWCIGWKKERRKLKKRTWKIR